MSALWWTTSRGYTLWFGDAEAHLNIARRIADSRTPGIDQFGTVWLPVPHLLMLPFAGSATLWRSGLAGSIPAVLAFAAACAFLFATLRKLFGDVAGFAGLAVFLLNPNQLYLATIPMTEGVFFLAVTGLFWAAVRFAASQSVAIVMAAALFSTAASMTRYEGWFLIPFVAGYLLIVGGGDRWRAALLFASLAAIAPLAWMFFNWWNYRNPFEFYNGPYSAKAIYERGPHNFPGDHNWLAAIHYYAEAARLVIGAPLCVLGIVGAIVGRARGVALLLALPPAFYVLSMHGSGAEIHIPTLWPHSHYNTRYATALMPLIAVGVAALVARLPRRVQVAAAVLAVAASFPIWIKEPITLTESRVNSNARRAWTHLAASYLREHYRPGDGVFTHFSDLTGILREAGIPLRESLHEGNNPEWMVTERRPALFLREGWAVAFSGDDVATAVQRYNRLGERYRLVARVIVPHADVVEIYQRTGGSALSELCRQGLINRCDE